VCGWLVLDKPPGVTSTQALNQVRRLFNAEKAGHGGTLDPIASGVLPIAFGDATKTVSLVMDAQKEYWFRVRWGEQTTTDDCEGDVVEMSPVRPTADAINAVLPAFTGIIEQVPPTFSAIKIDGARAYDLAREGEVVELAARTILIEKITLAAQPDGDHADFLVVSGKGAYMRALARDISLALGTVGHVAALRRLRVGRFSLERAISLDELGRLAQTADLDTALWSIEAALDDIPALALTDQEAHRLRLGQTVALLQRQHKDWLKRLPEDAGESGRLLLATVGGRAAALIRLEGIEVVPVRILNP